MADLDRMIEEAYAGFRHAAICPLVQIGDNLFVLELFHGPTLAFKDVAMQLLGRLMDHVLKARGTRATIVGATSGDTGSAAVEAFKGLDQVDVFILYPHGRVSDVQRRQMTTVDSANIHAIAVEGTFDDCQAMLKAMFNHERFRDETRLSGVNSINWARVAAQIVYYFTAAVSLGSPGRGVSFSVPTGNFGDILAGWAAKRMGLPIDRLMIGTNANDILVRALGTGSYEIRGVEPTTSPSMDIQVSSNFERLLFEAYGRDAGAIRTLMAGLAQSRSFLIDAAALARIRAEFAARAVDEPDGGRGDAADLPQHRLRPRPPHGGRHPGRPRPPRGRALGPGRRPGDRPSGEVSRRGGPGHGRSPGAAPPHGGPDGPPGILHGASQRPGRGAALHSRAGPGRARRRRMNRHFRETPLDITRLDNGFTVTTERMPEVATATLGVWVATGSRHELPHEHGLSHFIEHMAFKGTLRRSARQIAEDIENVGGDINAATSVEYTSYTARVLGETIDVALDVLGDILTRRSSSRGRWRARRA